MDNLIRRLEALPADERLVLTKLIYLAETHPQSFTPLDNRFNRQSQIVWQVFDALRKDSGRRA